MRNRPGHVPLLLLLAALPTFASPIFAGDTERVPVLDAAPGGLGRGPAAAPASPFERTILSGSPDGVVSPAPVAASRTTASNAPTNEDLAVLTEVNRLRALRSLAPMRFDARLFVAARAHSEEQLATNFLGHGSPDPERAKLSQRLTQGGYVGRMYAEVVAQNYADAVSVVGAWMESPAHRAVLLDADLTEGAFCRVSNPADPRVNRWTGDFGAPVLARATAALPSSPASAARTPNPAPRTQPVAPPAATRLSTPANPAPRTQAQPLAGNRTAVQPAPRPLAPAFGSDSGSAVPAPRTGTPTTLPLPSAPAPYVAPRSTGQPAYTAPPPVQYRAPVIIRRPAPRHCKT